MGLLDEFQSSVPGYYVTGQEDRFPWRETGGSVWYALLTVEDGTLKRYGFTSAQAQKAELLAALRSIPDSMDHLLLGVWTGQWKTQLFVLDRKVAIQRLSS